MAPYRCRPHERPGSSGQTSLVAPTSQSVRFARSLATRCDAGQPHLHTCVCPLEWVGEKRASTLVAGMQDSLRRIFAYACWLLRDIRDQCEGFFNVYPVFCLFYYALLYNPRSDFANVALTLNLLTTTIVAPPSNASKWKMGFNSAFKGLSLVFNNHALMLACAWCDTQKLKLWFWKVCVSQRRFDQRRIAYRTVVPYLIL